MKHIMRRTWILLLMLAVLTESAFAINDVSAVKLNQVQQRSADLTMYINMFDGSGNPITGNCVPEEFEAQVDDAGLHIDGVQVFDPQTMGIHYVFCIDVSASLTEAMMNHVHEGLCNFVDELGPMDTASLLTFGTTVETQLYNSADREAIKQAINATTADQGNTALYKGVLDGVELATQERDNRSTVVVITDGKNDVEKASDDLKAYTQDSIYDRVRTAQVPLYCIGLTDDDGVDSQSLKGMATETGGDQFEVPAAEISGSLNRVRNIMHSAVVLHSKLVNAEGKSGFNNISTFQVGFYNDDGGFVPSNQLQQAINWGSVPAPEAEPTPTVVPEISLSLDETSIGHVSDGEVTITGMINVVQGSVAQEDLAIYVNGKPWQAELMRNGNGYVFSATGIVVDEAESLEVQARGQYIASGIQRLEILGSTATPEPSVTPSPVMSVTLDDISQQSMFIPGESVEINGIIDIQGTIDSSKLLVFVNDILIDGEIEPLNANQYGFTVDYQMQESDAAELSVQVKLDGMGLASPKQRITLPTPTPTPPPELSLSLDSTEIIYKDGEIATIGGSVYVSGAVEPDDLALYVEGVRWDDLTMEEREDGSFHFEARNMLVGANIGQLDMRVKLLSDPSVGTEPMQVTAIAVTPSPPPPVTPPPETKESIEEPVKVEPSPTAASTGFVVILGDLTSNGKIWYLLAGAAVILILVIILIVWYGRKKKKRMVFPVNNGVDPIPNGELTIHDDSDMTIRITNLESSGTVCLKGEDEYEETWHLEDGNKYGGTRHLENGSEYGGTQRLEDESEYGGTRRLEDESEYRGTRRLKMVVRSIKLTIQERQSSNSQTFTLCEGEELTLGRKNAKKANVLIDDSTVSGTHAVLTYDGEHLFITDFKSKNGTKLNNQRLVPGTPREIKSGNIAVLGGTRIMFQIDSL